MAFVLAVAWCIAVPGLAQERTVTGTVTDTAGRPLQSASVLVRSTTTGTQTKPDGSFSLRVPATAQTLVISSVNYASQEVPIAEGAIVVRLEPLTAALADVVVIGYGTQQKKDVTGSIATVTSKDFQKGTITSPDQLIAGKVAGVSVTSNGGAPGAGSTIRIREGASLNASNDPLIIVDGIPLSEPRKGDGTSGISGAANSLALINPNDIETFTVLKDAASTAIYGSRASNGVIIITTKRGRRGKPQVNVVSNLSVATIAKKLDVLNADEMRNFVNNSPTATEAEKGRLGTANTDWQSLVFQNAITSDNNVSVSGALKNLPYRLSLGYLSQQGTLKTDLLQRGTVGINLSPLLFDKHLKIDINVKGSLSQSNFANQSAIGAAVSFDPTQTVYNDKGGYFEWLQSDGTFNPNAISNPVALLNQYHSTSYVSRSFGNIQFDYKFHFLADLHANLNLGYDVSQGHGSPYTDSSRQGNNNYAYRGVRSYYKQNNNNYVAEFYLNYLKDLRSINSNINAVAGYGYYDNKSTNYNNYTFFVDTKDTVPGSAPTYFNDIQQNTLISYYGRLIYTLANRYILQGSIRTDGSSRFAKENRWGVFPSAAFTWRINQENFLKNSRALSDLKLRLSYGVTGQQEGIANYSYLPAYYLAAATSQYQLGNTFYYPYTPVAYAADIKWEQTESYNAGIDIGFLKNRLSATVDVYTRKTKDLLNTLNLPVGTNFTNKITDNVGDMKSQGVEVTLNASPVVSKNFRWDLSYNFTYIHREITRLTKTVDPTFFGNPVGPSIDPQGTQVQINSIGYTPFAFYVYKQVYDTDGKPIEGLFADLNRDGIINNNDKYRYKSPFAPVKMGFTTSLTYKQWTLNALLRANIGNYMYNQVFSGSGNIAAIISPNNFIQNVPVAALSAGFQTYRERESDYYVYNASFLKMDNIGLSYNAGRIIKNKVNLTVGAYCQNVFIVTKYGGLDPEVYSGVDNNIYPRPRTYTLSVNLNF
ncbi:TonB-dependent receptor [Ilyomonas limi]|uniref:TonB-dependent receptor n=2 Tax=Ilyomonas limi TaxID=2575867 RepID=A0A4U3LDQ6_9BACT|nr:TonB-dependent receptor [Ilyomonas limi]